MFIKTRLRVNGVDLPIAGARYTEPSGVLGGSLSIALARPEVSSIPPGASVTFEIIAGKSDGAGGMLWSPVVLLSGGKLAGRSYAVNWQEGNPGRPGDLLNFNALNPLADRWGLAPMRPIVMFDPEKVDGESLTGDPTAYVKDEEGKALTPILEPIGGLRLSRILDRAYTKNPPALDFTAQALSARLGRNLYADSLAVGTGCGFDRVISNLPDFPVERADFTLEGGYHGGAAGLVALFEPIYFEDANLLYIIDTSRGIPYGYTPRTLPLSCVIDITNEVEAAETVNGIILSYRTRNPTEGGVGVAGYVPSKRQTTETVEAESGTTVVITKDLTDWKNLETGAVDYTTEDSVTTQTYGGGDKLISEETIETKYQFSGRLKVGHTRKVSARYPDPNRQNAPDKYEEVFTESAVIDWRTDLSSPGDSIMLRSITETEGVVLVEDSLIEGRFQYTPILDATRGGLIRGDATQHTARMPISTVIERLEETGLNQAQVITIIEDKLNGTVKTPPPVQSRTGSRSTSGGAKRSIRAATVVRELILDRASISRYGFRRAATLDVGELDPEEGRRITRVRLKRIANPRRRATITIPGIDFALRRGSIVIPPLRSGFDTAFIIIGRTITLRGLGTNNAQVNEVFEAIELG